MTRLSSVFLFILLVLFSSCGNPSVGKRYISDYVNPFIGASTNTEHSYHGLGKTFPGATTPFGMTQVSPNTITGGDNGSGYSYEHTSIEGFAFTQMSGVGWYGDLGNFLVMPTNGELKTIADTPDNPDSGYRSRYDKGSEIAKAGYYSVRLTDYDIKAEATASPHGGVLQFTFPKHEQSRIQIDLARRVGGTSVLQYIKVESDSIIRGWMKCTPEGGGWGNGEGHADYTVYFYATFSKPIKEYGFWSADIPEDWKRSLYEVTSDWYQQRIAESAIITNKRELQGKHLGFYTEFETQKDEEVIVKAAISFVNMEGAEKNFKAELAGHSFNDIYTETRKNWDNALSKIEITGGTEDEKTIFYTALYHTMIDPRMFSDIDGRYRVGNEIKTADSFTRRTIFSGWDVFRSQFPLQTIINPGLVNDQINSFVALAEENTTYYYDRWEFLNAYSGCMIGNPAISVLADAWMKNIRDYDMEKAYRYAFNTSKKFGNGERGYSTAPYSISNTLEYAYSDWCMAVLAKAVGKEEDVDYFLDRSQYYRNIFDAEKAWFRPKKESGEWEEWPENARTREWYGCIEANSYQQGWFVPFDIPGMVELMGGEEKTLADLVEFFERTPDDLLWNDYYNHANEPVHHVPFLFNRLNAPWLTQKWTRYICEKAYRNEVEGLVGNEDVGQMSAWYVLAAAGIHPVCPGEAIYEITSPVFDKIKFNLPSGKTFTIIANNNSPENRYILNIKLNGNPYKKFSITHEDIINGGTLELEMGSSLKNVNF